MFSIMYKGKSQGLGEVVKKCITSTGYEIFLIRFDRQTSIYTYLVAVKKDGETIEFKRFMPMCAKSEPFTYYLDAICCYA